MKYILILISTYFMTTQLLAKTVTFPIVVIADSEAAVHLEVKKILPDVLNGSYIYNKIPLSKVYESSKCFSHSRETVSVKALTIKKTTIFKNKKRKTVFRGFMNALHSSCL